MPRRASAYHGLDVPEFVRTKGGYIALAIVVLFAAFTGYVLWTLRDMPDPGKQDVLAGTVTVFDRKGRVIEQRNSNGQYHDIKRLKEMGKYGPDATLAAEDRNFYHHGAIDIGSTIRAAFSDVSSGGYSQGGSTITQQLINLTYYPGQSRLQRKIPSMVVALKVETFTRKRDILADYLTVVPTGRGLIGAQAAACAYFGHPLSQVTLAEAAEIAGMPQAPSAYDPRYEPQMALQRRGQVLNSMVSLGYISPAAAQAAQAQPVLAQRTGC